MWRSHMCREPQRAAHHCLAVSVVPVIAQRQQQANPILGGLIQQVVQSLEGVLTVLACSQRGCQHTAAVEGSGAVLRAQSGQGQPVHSSRHSATVAASGRIFVALGCKRAGSVQCAAAVSVCSSPGATGMLAAHPCRHLQVGQCAAAARAWKASPLHLPAGGYLLQHTMSLCLQSRLMSHGH